MIADHELEDEDEGLSRTPTVQRRSAGTGGKGGAGHVSRPEHGAAASLGDVGQEGEPCVPWITPSALSTAALRMLMYRGYTVNRRAYEFAASGKLDEADASEPLLITTCSVPDAVDRRDVRKRQPVIVAQKQTKRCRLFLCTNPSGLVAKCTDALQKSMKGHERDKALVLSIKPLRAQTRWAMDQWDFEVEVVAFNDLRACAASHVLTSPHFVMTEEQIVLAEKNYGHPRSKWQRMSLDDAVARFYGLKRGNVVFELKRTGTQPAFENFRLVE